MQKNRSQVFNGIKQKNNTKTAVLVLVGFLALALSLFYYLGINTAEDREEKAGILEEEVTAAEQKVSVESYAISSGEFFPGDEINSGLTIMNTSGKEDNFWIGCSIQDPLGNWHDLPAQETHLKDKEKTAVDFFWPVPGGESQLVSGPYLLTMAVWSEMPGEKNARRLATVQRKEAFHLLKYHEDFSSFNRDLWEKSEHPLGLGQLEADNVAIADDLLKITIPADTLDGGQLESKAYDHLYGSYRVNMKLPDAPSSITGFFLYRAPDYYHEVDIEIFNDTRGKVMFVTYAGGNVTNEYETYPGFDPTKDFYEYRFDFYPGKVSFYLEGVLLKTFKDGLTDKPMKLMINSWFPRWLDGIRPEHDAVTRIDWIKY